MVPSTAAAVVIFLLLVTPGIVFELRWQRTRPRRDESPFVEISRVLLAGTVFTGLAVATLVALQAAVPAAAVDFVELVRDGDDYVTRHPALIIGTMATAPTLAVLYAVAAHDLLTPASSRRIAHGTGWHVALSRMAEPGVRVFLSVQLKDSTTITGFSAGYSTDPDPGKRDLLLAAPLTIRRPGGTEPAALDRGWQTLVIAGAEISTIAAAYVETARKAGRPAPATRWLTRLGRHSWQASLAAVIGIVLVLLTVGLASS